MKEKADETNKTLLENLLNKELNNASFSVFILYIIRDSATNQRHLRRSVFFKWRPTV